MISTSSKRSTLLYLLWGLGIILATCACSVEDKSKNARARLMLDLDEIEVISDGRTATGAIPEVTITANLGYEAKPDADWITVEPSAGRGITNARFIVTENTSGQVRSGYVDIISENLKERIFVVQTLAENTDDGLDPGYVYFYEDFDWFEQFGGQDQVQFPEQGATKPLREHQLAMDIFEERGIWDYNWAGSCFYMAQYYLKMGKNNNQTGLQIFMEGKIEEGKTTDITLSFDAAPVVTYNATTQLVTGVDDTEITVEIYSGSGTVEGLKDRIVENLKMNIDTYDTWKTFHVNLYGISSNSVVVIRSTQWQTTGYHRWYLDNVKMVKSAK